MGLSRDGAACRGLTGPRRHSSALFRRAAAALAGIAVVGFAPACLLAAEPARPAAAPVQAVTNTPLRQISPGVFALGQIRIDVDERAITFPASVNMSEGLVEYALVHSTGKVHESLLRTDVDPYQLHLAFLLVRPQEANTAAPELSGQGPKELRGPPVTLEVTWTLGDQKQTVPIEDLITNELLKMRMSRGPWIYNGSRVVDGTFLAQRDGSFLSIIADQDALMNNPRPGRNDDEIWKANAGLVPPVGTLVEVTLRFQASGKSQGK